MTDSERRQEETMGHKKREPDIACYGEMALSTVWSCRQCFISTLSDHEQVHSVLDPRCRFDSLANNLLWDSDEMGQSWRDLDTKVRVA